RHPSGSGPFVFAALTVNWESGTVGFLQGRTNCRRSYHVARQSRWGAPTHVASHPALLLSGESRSAPKSRGESKGTSCGPQARYIRKRSSAGRFPAASRRGFLPTCRTSWRTSWSALTGMHRAGRAEPPQFVPVLRVPAQPSASEEDSGTYILHSHRASQVR